MRGPGFVGIGAQKAGTTWLWENLYVHPQLWLPLVKEVHWFDVQYPPSEAKDDPPYRFKRGLVRYRPLWRNPSLDELRWLWRFYHHTSGDQEYLDLFGREDGRLPGEITPAYSTLDASTVRRVHDLLRPDCRVLFLMREPVGRLWSAVRMDCRMRGVDAAALSDGELDAIASSPGMRLRSDYARTLENWSVFGDRLGLFFYEDLVAHAADFLRGVLAFVGVEAAWHSPKLDMVSNSGGQASGPPPTLAERWRTRFEPMVTAVAEKAGRLPSSWGLGQ
jgi:Sulfotransferase family